VRKDQSAATSSNACQTIANIPSVKIGDQFGDEENDELYAFIANEVENAYVYDEQGKIYNIIGAGFISFYYYYFFFLLS